VKILVYIFLLSFASSFQFNNISITPTFYSDYESEGFIWRHKLNQPIAKAGWGVNYSYEKDNFSVKGRFLNNRFFGITDYPSDFSFQQGLSWWGSDRGENDFDFDFSDLIICYKLKNSTLSAGKSSFNISEGKRSIIISNKSPSFPFILFGWDLNKYLSFKYIHGSLKSTVIDENLQSYYNQVGYRRLTTIRNFAYHSLEIKPNDRFKLFFAELVLYANRTIEPIYLIPLVPFWSAQHYLGDIDNMQIYVSSSYKFNENSKIYAAVLVDEWSPGDTFDKLNNRNWFSYQLGFNIKNLIENLSIYFEYNFSDHRVYRHRFSVNDIYSHGFPLGFWAGPHAEEYLLIAQKEISKHNLIFSYSVCKRGEITDEMLTYQYNNIYYERYSGINERYSKTTITFEPYLQFLKMSFLDNLDLGFHYSHIIYNELNSIEEIFNNKKNSFSITISYDLDKYYFGNHNTLNKH